MEFLRIPSVWDYDQISMALGDNGFDVVKILTVLRDKGVLHLRACLYDELKLGGMANLRESVADDVTQMNKSAFEDCRAAIAQHQLLEEKNNL